MEEVGGERREAGWKRRAGAAARSQGHAGLPQPVTTQRGRSCHHRPHAGPAHCTPLSTGVEAPKPARGAWWPPHDDAGGAW